MHDTRILVVDGDGRHEVGGGEEKEERPERPCKESEVLMSMFNVNVNARKASSPIPKVNPRNSNSVRPWKKNKPPDRFMTSLNSGYD